MPSNVEVLTVSISLYVSLVEKASLICMLFQFLLVFACLTMALPFDTLRSAGETACERGRELPPDVAVDVHDGVCGHRSSEAHRRAIAGCLAGCALAPPGRGLPFGYTLQIPLRKCMFRSQKTFLLRKYSETCILRL